MNQTIPDLPISMFMQNPPGLQWSGNRRIFERPDVRFASRFAEGPVAVTDTKEIFRSLQRMNY